MQEDNVSFSITHSAPCKLLAAEYEYELIELDLTAPSFTVLSFDYNAVDDNEEHIASLLIEDIHHLTLLRTHLLSKEVASVSTKEINLEIYVIKFKNTTPEEQALGQFTCKKLKNHPDWNTWQLAKF